MSEIIELDGVSKTYRDSKFRHFKALSDVSLKVKEGEAFGFIGPNGAGKSTTIKILTGIIIANGGTAKMFGIPVDDYRARLGMSYVPESPYLYDYLTPLEVLMMGCRMHKVSDTDLQKHCMSVLERFGIAHVANRRIRTFSKGMTQRTALAHALACKPKLLILDEPLSGLDPVGRKEVVDILRDYRSAGGTIFFSSHVLSDVERLVDRFGVIHKGTLRAVNTPAELVADSHHELIIRSRGIAQVAGVESQGEEKWQVQVQERELVEWIQRLVAAGHQITEVRNAITLEQAFLRFVQNAGGEHEPRAEHD